MSTIDKSSEYSFYYSCLKNPALVAKMNDYDKNLYYALKEKVARYGNRGLNNSGFGANSYILNYGSEPLEAVGGGDRNPLIFATKEDAVSKLPEIYKNQLVNNPTVSDLKPVKGKTGYYFFNSNLGTKYIYAYEPPTSTPKVTPNTSPKVPPVKTSPAMKAGVQSVISNSTKPKPVPVTPPKEIPSQYDLLFNSLNYLSVNEAEIEKMSMDLIFSGDDILTDFNYRSIDYLPDFEIEVKDKYGDFVDASSIFDQTETNDTTITTIYRGKVDKTVKTLDPIMDSLHKLLKDNLQNQPYSKVSKYLGTINKSGFSPGISRGQTVDFYFLLPKKYHKYEINLDFNPI